MSADGYGANKAARLDAQRTAKAAEEAEEVETLDPPFPYKVESVDLTLFGADENN